MFRIESPLRNGWFGATLEIFRNHHIHPYPDFLCSEGPHTSSMPHQVTYDLLASWALWIWPWPHQEWTAMSGMHHVDVTFLRHNTAKPMLLMLMLQCRQDRLITGSACHWHNVTGCEIGSRASMVRSLEDLLQGPCPFQQPRPVASDSSAVRWGTGERGNGRRSRAKARLSQGPVQGHRPTHLDTKNPFHTFVFQEFVLNKSQRKNDWATLRLKTLLLKNSRKFSERPRSKPPDHLGATQLIDRNVFRFFFQILLSMELVNRFMIIYVHLNKMKKIAWHFKMIIHEHVPGIEFWANLRPGPWRPGPFWPRRRKWVVVLQRKLPRCDPQISCFWWCGPGEWSAMMCNVDIISY